jgi:tRNA1Val (adenine37-N6)-methyltransferase
VTPGPGRDRSELLGPEETGDSALGGTVRLVQPRKGYRFGIDAVLLARFAAERPAARALDLGCGCGAVSLCLLALGGAREALGIDLQEPMVDRARRAARWNGLEGRARFEVADMRGRDRTIAPQSFDLVVANPPYRPASAGRTSPDPASALARHELAGSLADAAAAAAYALGTGGAFCAVYPAARLATLLEGCRGTGLEPKVLQPVHPREGEPASLVLVRCLRGGGEGLELRSPLFLHAAGGGYSPEAQRLLGPP